MIDMELTGIDHQPAAADIIRTSGDQRAARASSTAVRS